MMDNPQSLSMQADGSPATISWASPAYQGVWARTLLETPGGRDTGANVRWFQTARWQGAIDADGHVITGLIEGPAVAHSVFQTPDRIVQTGLRDRHLAIWERMPQSLGRRITLARRGSDGAPTEERLLVCGDFLLHVAPTANQQVALRFGRISEDGQTWQVELDSHHASAGSALPWRLQRLGMDLAVVSADSLLTGAWEVMEWMEG
ncbi:MAG: hypothetical protein KF871_08980 [Hydrogenophaga sp.]|uniref:hypothetical protein n=1 Tax=Hydrogenophaga sp. TaxID=1904254 RepID=UPI001DD692F1|nr:hypothetical protein [Hydrogenophaga sp.]MBX3610020.1 hypothetical protein [Hydrogenophaga sp.]